MIPALRTFLAEQRAGVAEDLNVRAPSLRAHAQGFASALDRLEAWLNDHVGPAPLIAARFRCRCGGDAEATLRSTVAGGTEIRTALCRCGRPVSVTIVEAPASDIQVLAEGDGRG